MEVGFIGLGKMGRPMVERLLGAGHRVHIYARSGRVVENLAELGALPAAGAAEVGERCEIVMTALPTIDAVLSVYAVLGRIAHPGQVLVDHSTVSIDVNRRCASMVKDAGGLFLDAPMSGGPEGAASGTLTVMVGGDAEAFERARPIFEAFAANIKLCGPVGAGQAVKLVNQLLVAIHTAAAAEAAVFGAMLGASPELLLEVIGTSFGGSAMLTRSLPRFMTRDFSGATPVALLVKDLGIVHDEARMGGVPLLIGALVEQRFVEANGRGWGVEDMVAVVKLWEKQGA